MFRCRKSVMLYAAVLILVLRDFETIVTNSVFTAPSLNPANSELLQLHHLPLLRNCSTPAV